MKEGLPASEWFNFWTHFAGLIFAIVGLIYLLLRAEGAVSVIAYTIYGSSMILMYASSAIYHVIPEQHDRSTFLRRFDHICIYLLIAGSYTPVCVLAVPPVWGVPCLSIVWAFGIFGILEKIFHPLAPSWRSAALYVTMGWLAALCVPAIIKYINFDALLLLASGGLVYTLGAIVYVTDRPNILPRFVGAHGIWHLCVLLASGLHFAFNVAYVPTT